ncbi:hypothetical protein R3I94_005013 [Phoxinus phoxinus]
MQSNIRCSRESSICSMQSNPPPYEEHTSQCDHKPFWAVEDMLPNKGVWGQPLPDHLQKMVVSVLDPNSDTKEHIVSVGSTVLLRSDFLSLGLSEGVEATILNCCLQIVRARRFPQGYQCVCC